MSSAPMRHVTVRLPAPLLARLEHLRRATNAAGGRRPPVSRSGLLVDLLDEALAARERAPAPATRASRPPPPAAAPAAPGPRPRRRATAAAPAPPAAATPSGPADGARVAAVAEAFRAAVATDAITPGDWHDFVKAHAPDMRHSAIRAWFNQQRLPARDPAAAARMLALVEAWLDDRRGGSSG